MKRLCLQSGFEQFNSGSVCLMAMQTLKLRELELFRFASVSGDLQRYSKINQREIRRDTRNDRNSVVLFIILLKQHGNRTVHEEAQIGAVMPVKCF